MIDDSAIAAVSHAIQLSVAPVFLLSGIGGLLAVETNRLSRIIDRGRVIEERLYDGRSSDRSLLDAELATLAQRARFIDYAIALCTVTALCVCAVIATLFVAGFLALNASGFVAVLFVTAMVTLFVGLLYFLREIFIATRFSYRPSTKAAERVAALGEAGKVAVDRAEAFGARVRAGARPRRAAHPSAAAA